MTGEERSGSYVIPNIVLVICLAGLAIVTVLAYVNGASVSTIVAALSLPKPAATAKDPPMYWPCPLPAEGDRSIITIERHADLYNVNCRPVVPLIKSITSKGVQ